MIFPKIGQVRIEQLRDEILHNIIEFPQMAIQWNGVDAVEIEDVNGNATTHQMELQAAIDAHDPTMFYFDWEKEPVIEETARTGWRDLGDWATWEPQQAQDYVMGAIFAEMTQAQVEEWIDDNVTGATIAQLRAQMIVALKMMAANIIAVRTILGIIAKVVLYIRDILIKRL